MAKNSSLTVNTTNLSFERLMIGIRTKIVSMKVSRIVEFLWLKFKEKTKEAAGEYQEPKFLI